MAVYCLLRYEKSFSRSIVWDTVRMLYAYLLLVLLFLIEITAHYVKAKDDFDNEVIYQDGKSLLFSL